MMRKLFLTFLSLCSLFAATIVKPHAVIDVTGNVVDMVRLADRLYIGTDAGKFEIYDWKSRKMVSQIKFDKIHDFMGDLVAPKVFCVDVTADGKKKLTLVQAEGGNQNLYLFEQGKRTHLLGKKEGIQMREVRFVDDTHLLIATISNDLIYMQIPSKKILWRKKLSLSVFSDFQLNEDHSKVASSCESGIVYVVDVASGKLLKTLQGGNKDEVFSVDFKNYHVLACGKDKKAVLYSLGYASPVIYETSFFVYAGALDKKAKRSAFQIDENNDIGIYDNETKEMKYKLVGQQSVLNNIVFIDDKTLISSSSDNHIMIWRLP